uniref:Uncharacterized protein n=1 Tax=viral metagenome TaxID=1070528 RepID=A0A6C0IGK0_9ZZZZ
MTHFNKLIYENDQYDKYDYNEMNNLASQFDEEIYDDVNEVSLCEKCNCETDWMRLRSHNNNWICVQCVDDTELLKQYSKEQQMQLSKYAACHKISIEEAIEYQTHCHYCGTHIKNAVFDEEQHQYCNRRCWESCEDYWYPCDKGEDCRVCQIWEYQKHREERVKMDFEIAHYEPVLTTIDAFQELCVYAQLYECLGDLVEYFDE